MQRINWHLVMVLIIGAVALLLLISLIDAREGRIRAEATSTAQTEVQKGLLSQMDELKRTVKEMKDAQAAKVAANDTRFRAAVTPEEVATIAQQVMNLKSPIKFETPPATAENPHPEPVAVVAASDTPQVREYLRVCEECKINLETKTKELTYADQQAELDKKTIASITIDRDAWKKASKGTFWSNAKRNGKAGLIGAGVAIAVACALGHCPK